MTAAVRHGPSDGASQRDALLEAQKTARDLQRKTGAESPPPWYLTVGWPAAGKSAALRNSGLQFATADGAGPGSGGVEYRFAEDAVLIDAPGRFTGDDSERGEWLGFLRLLKRSRPVPALNGVLVMVAADELITLAAEERVRRAKAIRQRLHDVDGVLGLNLPVYVVFTRLDRLAGFAGFFAALPAADREQVLGATRPAPEPGRAGLEPAAWLSDALRRLCDRLEAKQLDRLASERDAGRRVQIFAFPRQFALLVERAKETIGEIAASSRLERPLRLRGVYFASARQDGYAVDPLGQATAERFGVDLPLISGGRGEAGFFLTRLFKDVVFVERNVVSLEAGGGGRSRLVLAALGAVAAVGFGAFWFFAYSTQQQRLADADTRLAAYSADAKTIRTRDVADADFVKAARSLDQIRDIGKDWPEGGLGVFAFDQSAKLRAAITELYDRGLDLILAPRIFVGLQQEIQAPQGPAEPAKLYLTLAGKAPLDKASATPALAAFFDRRVQGADAPALRQSLKEHAKALLAKPLAPLALDEIAVEDAKARAAGQ
jgi:type VI secretion system protein ImpL